MDIYKTGPGKTELSVIDGGGNSAAPAETFLQYARRMVTKAFGEKPETPESPYGHLSPVPSLPEGPVASDSSPENSPLIRPAGVVRSITEAPSYRPAQYDVVGTSALAPTAVHTTAEGELMSAASKIQRRMEYEAREEAEVAHSMGPEPLNPEDFLQ